MRETWYILEDGTSVHPSEVSTDDNGALRHESGAAIAIGSHGNPRTRGVDIDESGKLIASNEADLAAADRRVAAEKQAADDKAAADKKAGGKASETKDQTPGPGGEGYKTRDQKAK